MKKILLLFFSLVAAMSASAQGSYDFTAVNTDGITFYYRITDAVNRKVEIVQTPTSSGMHGGYTINGRLEIPAEVENGGTTYKVTAITAFFAASGSTITDLILHEGLETIGYTFFWQLYLSDGEITIPSTVTSYGGGAFYQTWWTAPSVTIRLLNPIPAPGDTGVPCFNINYMAAFSVDMKLLVPTDATYAYCSPTTIGWAGRYSWSSYVDYYREELTIGPNGYTSYYLENENFLVPAGCTAYIVKGVTSTTSSYGTAVVQAFSAGSIIPKQTGFILEGTPNATIVYQANVTGTEVDVTGNLLVGTATEQEFSGTGYKYYLFGKGSRGQGFYHQGTRGGESIKLQAHKAGLRLPTSGFAPAKDFVFDFEEAKRNATTGITTAVTVDAGKADEAVYDLQGRRVTNPSKGVYIVNGKKVVK